jgi:hypothetical protein
MQSVRTASGDEALIARVAAGSGKIGYGFSLSLDATEARHMAERHAGLRQDGIAAASLPAEISAAIASIRWLPA